MRCPIHRASLPAPGLQFEAAAESLDVAGLRAAWSLDAGYALVDPEVAAIGGDGYVVVYNDSSTHDILATIYYPAIFVQRSEFTVASNGIEPHVAAERP